MPIYYIKGKKTFTDKELSSDELKALEDNTEEKPPEKSYIQQISDAIPQPIKNFGHRLLDVNYDSGVTNKLEQLDPKNKYQVAPDSGNNIITQGASKLANIVDNPRGEGGYGKGFLAGGIQGLGNVISDAFDPRTAGIRAVNAMGPSTWRYGTPSTAPDILARTADSTTPSMAGRLLNQQSTVDTSRLAQNIADAGNPALQYGPRNAPLGLPPARPIDTQTANYAVGNIDPATQGGRTNFIAGDLGTVPTGSPFTGPLARGSVVMDSMRFNEPVATAMDTNAIAEAKRVAALRGGQGFGNTVTIGRGPESSLPAISGETAGGFTPQSQANLPYPLNVVPNAVRPRTIQTNILRTAGDITEPVRGPEPLPDIPPIPPTTPRSARELINTAEPLKVEQESAVPKPLRKAQIKPTPPEVPPTTTTPTEPIQSGVAKTSLYRPIAVTATPKEAIKQWADGRTAGASYRGNNIAEKFEGLRDPQLMDAFEQGDRSGGLKELADYFESRHVEGVKAGLFKEDQKIPNYVRHEFTNTDEEIQVALNKYISKNPSLAKTRTFPTYAAAEEAGLTRKFKNIPDMVRSYEFEFNRALRDKELYDYLQKTKQLKGALSSRPTFLGPNATELAKLYGNVTAQSPDLLKGAADIASASKNITLGGGIPYTKYNMHAWNIAKNDAALNGYVPALKKLFSDPLGNKAVQWMKDLPEAEKNTLADLVDRGWQGHPMSDTGHAVNIFERGAKAVENTAGKKTLELAGKGFTAAQKATEAPLFEKALPALGAQRTLEAFHALEPQMGREAALKAAAEIGNNFYGGVDTVLRNPVYKDLGRITFLAPNWMESQITKALNQWKGAAKTVVGKANPAEKIYAKSLARSAALPAIGAITSGVTTGSLLNNKGSRDIAAIPLGEDEKGKKREFPTLTTATEEFRIPVAAPIRMFQGDPAALKDLLIKNRISTPANTFWDLVRGEDQFGNPLAKQDKYGKPITSGKGVMNYATEASKPFQHQALQAMIAYMQGKISREEAIAQGLELPLSYTKK